MTKVETKYYRKGKTITTVEGDVVETFKSINAAKRWSAAQQRENGGLGMGFVRVIHKGSNEPIAVAA